MKALVSKTTRITIPFYDLDSMGICWHGNYVKYFEDARCELLKKIDYDYPEMSRSNYYWPIVELNIKYVRPLRYDQVIEVVAEIIEYQHRLKIRYTVIDVDSGEKITKGFTTQVAVEKDSFEMQLVSPPILQDKLSRYL